jgi:hypothetical protein
MEHYVYLYGKRQLAGILLPLKPSSIKLTYEKSKIHFYLIRL